jgi:hypothetical protein
MGHDGCCVVVVVVVVFVVFVTVPRSYEQLRGLFFGLLSFFTGGLACKTKLSVSSRTVPQTHVPTGPFKQEAKLEQRTDQFIISQINHMNKTLDDSQ